MATTMTATDSKTANTITTTSPSIYSVTPVPDNHIATIAASPDKPATPSSPDYGLDSLAGLIASFVAAPLYLYATLKGKSAVWDDIVDALPDSCFTSDPVMDVGCGRGLVLLKLAQRKKKLGASSKAYGIDIFSVADQTGNSPVATYRNAAALGVVEQAVLNTASFTEAFPFADDTFSLLTSNLAIHNVRASGRQFAMREMARVCKPGGKIIVVDLFGAVAGHKKVLREELGWTDVDVSMVGWKMVFGTLPCQILTATKPE